MHLLVGLGNPGPRYRKTRHNCGYLAVERIAQASQARWTAGVGTEAESAVAEGELEGEPVVLAKPETYMNASGRAVLALCRAREVVPSGVLLYLDEVALPLGSLRVRERGGAAGHKGLASVLDALESKEVPRVRLGIRPAEAPEDLTEFVLEPFTADERKVLDYVLERTVDATRMLLKEGIAKAMSVYNRTVPPA